jgi:hypothetical protein
LLTCIEYHILSREYGLDYHILDLFEDGNIINTLFSKRLPESLKGPLRADSISLRICVSDKVRVEFIERVVGQVSEL